MGALHAVVSRYFAWLAESGVRRWWRAREFVCWLDGVAVLQDLTLHAPFVRQPGDGVESGQAQFFRMVSVSVTRHKKYAAEALVDSWLGLGGTGGSQRPRSPPQRARSHGVSAPNCTFTEL